MSTKVKSMEQQDYIEKIAENNHYVNNKEILVVMKEYRELYLVTKANNTERPPMPPKVANAIVQIATKMSRMHNFFGYSYRSDMISDAILQLTAKFHLFDPLKSDNFFGYASQLCWNAFIGRIKMEQKQTSIRARLINEKVTTEFIQQNLEGDTEGTNAFVDFLKENEIFIDYFEQRKTTEKTGNLHSSLRHKNLTPYTKAEKTKKSKEVVEPNLFDLVKD
jgi:hypothetical protein